MTQIHLKNYDQVDPIVSVQCNDWVEVIYEVKGYLNHAYLMAISLYFVVIFHNTISNMVLVVQVHEWSEYPWLYNKCVCLMQSPPIFP